MIRDEREKSKGGNLEVQAQLEKIHKQAEDTAFVLKEQLTAKEKELNALKVRKLDHSTSYNW